MARIRYIKPDFFSDTRLAEVSVLARFFYIGLFCQLDRNGVVLRDSKLLKREIFPYDDQITPTTVKNLLEELVKIGRLYPFSEDGKEYIFCPTLTKHQKFHREEKNKYPFSLDDLLTRCLHPASTLPALTDASANSTGNGELVTGNWQLVTGNAAPSLQEGDRISGIPGEVKKEWETTLVQYGRSVNWFRDEPILYRVYQRVKDWHRVQLALAGFRFESRGPSYNPAKHVYLTRLEDKGSFDYLEGLGETKPTEGISGVNWDQIEKRIKLDE